MLVRYLLAALASQCLLSDLSAQEIEDQGPHPVGTLDISIPDPNSAGVVDGKLYYPALTAGDGAQADPAGGPYPLVGFQHGWLGFPEAYDDLSSHIASWGFFVVSVGTETGFNASMILEAQDTASLMDDVNTRSQTPGDAFVGMVSADDWSAVGHSMGGGGLFHLIGFEPRIRNIVPMQPYRGPLFGGTASAQSNIDTFDGDVLVISGEVDTTVPPATGPYPFYLDLDVAARRIYFEVAGMGHSGPTDFPSTGEPLSAAEQQRMHALLVTGFLRSEVKQEEDLYVEIVGQGGMMEPIETLEAIAPDPIHWTEVSSAAANTIVTGMAGNPGDLALIAGSLGTISFPTVYGLLELDPSPGIFSVVTAVNLDATGLLETPVFLGPALAGVTVYTQALLFDGSPGILTRRSSIVAP